MRIARTAIMLAVVLIAVGIVGFAMPAGAVEHPPTGTSPSDFATEDHGCLGPLRSQIAQGNFAGVGPFGDHFTGDVNPGAHQGTVGEEEFLTGVLGVTDVDAFCAQFG